ncbi:MAG: hypothetical protein GVX78_01215 [Bacteroidetes bacterium]|jgi:hypothetical protein|nr:hypothetical protein [Bacteroidota bacterium]
MNIKTEAFDPIHASSEIFPRVLFEGTKLLKNSRPIDKYGISAREVFGLCIIAHLRCYLEPERKWVFSTDQEISDDGLVASVADNGNRINYYECIEQVYLPGHYINRSRDQDINSHILEHVARTKNKGSEYKTDKSLLVLSDIKSKAAGDYFKWQDFVKSFFAEKTFLHLYFISLQEHTPTMNQYYLLSFTNQKHRQKLNGEFEVKVSSDGSTETKCLQKMNLLK